MAAKQAFTVGDVKVYARSQYWHCSYWSPSGRQRKALRTSNRRAAERKARQIDDLVSRQAWEDLAVLDEEKQRPVTFQEFVYHYYLPKYCDWSESTRRGNGSRLKMLCVEWGSRSLSSITARDIKTYLKRRARRTA